MWTVFNILSQRLMDTKNYNDIKQNYICKLIILMELSWELKFFDASKNLGI